MIRKHSVIWFYVFTLIFTIILGGTSQALCVNFVSKQYQTIVSLVLVQMAPTLGTILVLLWTKDKDCYKNMNW
jgi:RsiW-degrading membrane proteinase PrsW (M82 family)